MDEKGLIYRSWFGFNHQRKGRRISERVSYERQGKSFIEEILKKSEEAKQELEKKTETLINQALKKTDIPSKKEFISVSRRLAKLEEKIEELKKEITEK
jgi:polyhydroxyalkanoate synthesis regulator phasin